MKPSDIVEDDVTTVVEVSKLTEDSSGDTPEVTLAKEADGTAEDVASPVDEETLEISLVNDAGMLERDETSEDWLKEISELVTESEETSDVTSIRCVRLC